jgi:hypothetical protein
MGELDYALESEVECLNNDPNDVAFVRATATIRGRDVVEEYVACKIYPLAASFGFESAPLGTTPPCRRWRLPCHYLLWEPSRRSKRAGATVVTSRGSGARWMRRVVDGEVKRFGEESTRTISLYSAIQYQQWFSTRTTADEY